MVKIEDKDFLMCLHSQKHCSILPPWRDEDTGDTQFGRSQQLREARETGNSVGRMASSKPHSILTEVIQFDEGHPIRALLGSAKLPRG